MREPFKFRIYPSKHFLKGVEEKKLHWLKVSELLYYIKIMHKRYLTGYCTTTRIYIPFLKHIDAAGNASRR